MTNLRLKSASRIIHHRYKGVKVVKVADHLPIWAGALVCIAVGLVLGFVLYYTWVQHYLRPHLERTNPKGKLDQSSKAAAADTQGGHDEEAPAPKPVAAAAAAADDDSDSSGMEDDSDDEGSGGGNGANGSAAVEMVGIKLAPEASKASKVESRDCILGPGGSPPKPQGIAKVDSGAILGNTSTHSIPEVPEQERESAPLSFVQEEDECGGPALPGSSSSRSEMLGVDGRALDEGTAKIHASAEVFDPQVCIIRARRALFFCPARSVSASH
jgi:hypothetical protein